jgi:hypothetical protein
MAAITKAEPALRKKKSPIVFSDSDSWPIRAAMDVILRHGRAAMRIRIHWYQDTTRGIYTQSSSCNVLDSSAKAAALIAQPL